MYRLLLKVVLVLTCLQSNKLYRRSYKVRQRVCLVKWAKTLHKLNRLYTSK